MPHAVPFTFQPERRAIIDTASGSEWVLCPHLTALLSALLAQPATLVSVSTGWSRTDLSVTLSRGPALEAVPSFGPIPPGVTSWANNDTHYSIEFGVACGACKHSISWPQ
jgi:hypothetical protein